MKLRTAILIAVFLMFSCVACEEQLPDGEGFALYLLSHDIPASNMTISNDLELPDEAIISMEEIVTYSRMTHEIELTVQAYEKLTGFDVSTGGKVFIACVDRQPVYWGAFWVPYSSQSFDGIVILIPPFTQQQNTVRIETGYPSDSFYSGGDPRDDSRIMQSLRHAGKLRL